MMQILTALEALCKEAQAIALKYFQTSAVNVSEKPDASLVTNVDRELNQFFIEKLTALIPDSVVIGEEAHSIQSFEQMRRGQRLIWILDPLDGTREFVAGTNQWAIQLALFSPHSGVTLAVIYQPTTNLFSWAMPGKGAFQKNLTTGKSEQLRANKKDQVEASVLLVSKSRKDSWVEKFCATKKFKDHVSYGSIGLKALEIAKGSADFYLNGDGKCGAWDLLPCLPFLTESGAGSWTSRELNWSEEIQKNKVEVAFAFGVKPLLEKVTPGLEASLS